MTDTLLHQLQNDVRNVSYKVDRVQEYQAGSVPAWEFQEMLQTVKNIAVHVHDLADEITKLRDEVMILQGDKNESV